MLVRRKLCLKVEQIHPEIVGDAEAADQHSRHQEQIQIPLTEPEEPGHQEVDHRIEGDQKYAVIPAEGPPEGIPAPVHAEDPGNDIGSPERQHGPVHKIQPSKDPLKKSASSLFTAVPSEKSRDPAAEDPVKEHQRHGRNGGDTVKMVLGLQNVVIIVIVCQGKDTQHRHGEHAHDPGHAPGVLFPQFGAVRPFLPLSRYFI